MQLMRPLLVDCFYILSLPVLQPFTYNDPNNASTSILIKLLLEPKEPASGPTFTLLLVSRPLMKPDRLSRNRSAADPCTQILLLALEDRFGFWVKVLPVLSLTFCNSKIFRTLSMASSISLAGGRTCVLLAPNEKPPYLQREQNT